MTKPAKAGVTNDVLTEFDQIRLVTLSPLQERASGLVSARARIIATKGGLEERLEAHKAAKPPSTSSPEELYAWRREEREIKESLGDCGAQEADIHRDLDLVHDELSVETRKINHLEAEALRGTLGPWVEQLKGDFFPSVTTFLRGCHEASVVGRRICLLLGRADSTLPEMGVLQDLPPGRELAALLELPEFKERFARLLSLCAFRMDAAPATPEEIAKLALAPIAVKAAGPNDGGDETRKRLVALGLEGIR